MARILSVFCVNASTSMIILRVARETRYNYNKIRTNYYNIANAITAILYRVLILWFIIMICKPRGNVFIFFFFKYYSRSMKPAKLIRTVGMTPMIGRPVFVVFTQCFEFFYLLYNIFQHILWSINPTIYSIINVLCTGWFFRWAHSIFRS